ncbi:hypothetical protein FA13DRAFT_1735386 [Coprinellus micaceus]|uniref:RRM Nup35-type domain-containing protein n=1 Tax=Coprinellus micaceus TaxID=71717 RepID=A0A4Y7T4C2_COPMI|nr:hypothetical protein FA13DRAFT_1735386 [Coprinellus micaceus]
MQNSHFTVAGMSSSTSSHHTPNLNTWGSSSTSNSFSDSLSQSRSHYQSGYLMSATQNTNSPQGNQRVDEAPVIQTKAKLNQVLTRGTASDFGMESMFQSTSRQRQNLADEDAPPMSSVNDIPNEVFLESTSTRFQPRQSTLDASRFGKRHTQAPAVNTTNEQPIYIIVFGYPADKYTVTVEYFKRSGASTEADPSTEIQNCFRIGYSDPATALRAVRKNGEILESSYMIGVKWADQAQADALLGQPGSSRTNSTFGGDAMNVDEPVPPSASSTFGPTPSFANPISLQPATSALRRPGAPSSKPATPQVPSSRSFATPPGGSVLANGGGGGTAQTSPGTPSKSMLGQVSDLIFGW